MLSDLSFNAARGRRNPSLFGAGCALSLLCACWQLAGCSLDERTLTVESPSTSGGNGGGARGGSPGSETGGAAPTANGGGPAAEAGSGGEGGEAGASDGNSPTTFPDGCADLDHDGKSDCTQTLVENPDFKLDVSHWEPETGVLIKWDAMDLLTGHGSGSALVSSTKVLDSDGDFLATASQCIPVEAGKTLDVYANVRIEAGGVPGKAALSLWFFRAADCPDESPSDVYVTNQVYDTGTTLTLSGSKEVAPQMSSLRVRLGVIKPFRADTFSVRFDNVLVAAH